MDNNRGKGSRVKTNYAYSQITFDHDNNFTISKLGNLLNFGDMFFHQLELFFGF